MPVRRLGRISPALNLAWLVSDEIQVHVEKGSLGCLPERAFHAIHFFPALSRMDPLASRLSRGIHVTHLLFSLLCRTKPARSLLIHLGTWCHPIDRHVEKFSWTHDVEQSIDVSEDIIEDFGFLGRCWSIFRMKTRMDDSIHVQVQVIEFHTVRIGFRCIDRNRNAFDRCSLSFHAILDDERIALSFTRGVSKARHESRIRARPRQLGVRCTSEIQDLSHGFFLSTRKNGTRAHFSDSHR